MTNKERRENGKHACCMSGYEECVMNYESAKKDKFDSSKWELHHKMENYFNRHTLIENGMYYNVCPFDLIWLPRDEHRADSVLSNTDPDSCKYHRHSMEKKRGWKDSEKYIACEGKHQLEDHEQYKRYQLEYQRKYREENPNYYRDMCRIRRAKVNVVKLEEKIKSVSEKIDEHINMVKVIENNGMNVSKGIISRGNKLTEKLNRLIQKLKDTKALLVEGN